MGVDIPDFATLGVGLCEIAYILVFLASVSLQLVGKAMDYQSGIRFILVSEL